MKTTQELLATIRQEIERRITDNTFGAKLELIDILAYLDSLSVNDPEGLDEAAWNYASKNCEYDAFKAGAEWAFGQGYSQEYRIQYNEGVSDTSTQSRQMTFTIPVPNDFLDGDKMIVQIRKK